VTRHRWLALAPLFLLGGCEQLSDVSVFLLVISAIFLIGILGELAFAKTGVPDVIWLIVVGIVLGPVGGLVTKPSLEAAAPFFGAITLVVVLFNGGSELKLKELAQSATRGSILAVLGFLLAVAFVAPVAKLAVWIGILPESWGWMHCILLGTILGGSSSVVIMPALSKAGLSPRINNLVNLESALTDVLSVVGTGAVIQIMRPAPGEEAGAGTAAVTLGQNFGVGIALGAVAGLLAVLVLRQLRKSAYAYPLTLGGLMVLYVLVDELGGSAALAILTAAVMIGNAPTLSKAIGLAKTARLGSNVRGVHGEMTFIIKSFFFCFIGAMLGPPWGMLAFGVFIGLVLFAARLPNVVVVTMKSGLSKPARALVSVLFPRGMAAGVLAMMPTQAGITGTQDLPVVVFAAVFTTILHFAFGFPVLKGRLTKADLADPSKVAAAPADASTTHLPGASEPPPPIMAHPVDPGAQPAPLGHAPQGAPPGAAAQPAPHAQPPDAQQGVAAQPAPHAQPVAAQPQAPGQQPAHPVPQAQPGVAAQPAPQAQPVAAQPHAPAATPAQNAGLGVQIAPGPADATTVDPGAAPGDDPQV